MPISTERWSFTGFLSAMRAFDITYFIGVLYIVGACLWSVEALWSFWTLKSVSACCMLHCMPVLEWPHVAVSWGVLGFGVMWCVPVCVQALLLCTFNVRLGDLRSWHVCSVQCWTCLAVVMLPC